ncbi:hypothetical protein HDU67_002239 [Dinochytrium kinnereticum]|nr:hypothetical protein HDU67_002239 [Dinochytrium kinnereticum]
MVIPAPHVLLGSKAVLMGPLGVLLLHNSRLVWDNPLIKGLFNAFGLKVFGSGDKLYSSLIGSLILAFTSSYASGALMRSRDVAKVSVVANFVVFATTMAGRAMGNMTDVGVFFGMVDGVFAATLAASLMIHKNKKAKKD